MRHLQLDALQQAAVKSLYECGQHFLLQVLDKDLAQQQHAHKILKELGLDCESRKLLESKWSAQWSTSWSLRQGDGRTQTLYQWYRLVPICFVTLYLSLLSI